MRKWILHFTTRDGATMVREFNVEKPPSRWQFPLKDSAGRTYAAIKDPPDPFNAASLGQTREYKLVSMRNDIALYEEI